MKLNKKDIEEIKELIDAISNEAESFKSIAKSGIDLLLQFGPELKTFFSAYWHGVADLKIDIIAKYQKAGFTREEAILITCEDVHQMTQSLKTINAKK